MIPDRAAEPRPLMVRRAALAVGMVACLMLSQLSAQAQPANGLWETRTNADGEVLFFSAGSGDNDPVVFARCGRDTASVSVRIPARGGYAQARRLVGRATQLRFNAGRDEFRFAGRAAENGSAGSIDLTFSVVIGHNLFSSVRAASSMKVSGELGDYSLRYPDPSAAISEWQTKCGYRPPQPSPVESTRKPGTVHPAGAAGSRPSILAARQEAYAQECASAGGRATFSGDFVRTGDLNGDGTPDYVLDVNATTCTGALNPFCGLRGCAVDVFMSEPDGRYREVEGWIGIASVDIVRSGDRDVVVLGGRDGATRHRWNGRSFARIR